MTIESIGSMQNILKNHKSKVWSEKTDNISDFKFPEIKGGIPEINDSQTFSEMLTKSITDVNSLQNQANKSIERLVTGKSKNLHETMLAVEKAEIAFKSMNQIRQKVLDAYKEIMHMQL